MAQVCDCRRFGGTSSTRAWRLPTGTALPRGARNRARGRLRRRGWRAFLEWTSGMVYDERVTVTVAPDGFIEIFGATQAMGQGIATSYAQLAVDIFDVPIERIRIPRGDTDRGPGLRQRRIAPHCSSAVRRCAWRRAHGGPRPRTGQARRSAPLPTSSTAQRASPSPAPTSASTSSRLAGRQPPGADRRRREQAASAARRGLNGCRVSRGRDRPGDGRGRGRRLPMVNDIGQRRQPGVIVRQAASRRRRAGHRPGPVRAIWSTRPRAAGR